MKIINILKSLDEVIFEVTDRVLVTGKLTMNEEIFLVVLVFEMNLLDVVGIGIPTVKCTILVNDVVTEQFEIEDDKEVIETVNWLQTNYNKFRDNNLSKAKKLLQKYQ